MTAIIGFLGGIADAVLAALEFLASIIKDTLYVVQLTAESVSMVPVYLQFFPPAILTLILAIYIVVVVYMILGRK